MAGAFLLSVMRLKDLCRREGGGPLYHDKITATYIELRGVKRYDLLL